MRTSEKVFYVVFGGLSIAAAIVAGFVLFSPPTMFCSNGGPSGHGGYRERVEITSVSGFVNGTVRVSARCFGFGLGDEVEITDAILKRPLGSVVEVKSGLSIKLPTSGETNSLTINFSANAIAPDPYYTVTIVSKLGWQHISPLFKT